MGGEGLIRPRDLELLSGDERVGPGTVLEFWRWALGDLRMNNARGYLVEWLVAKALDDRSARRVEWGAWDVEAADGTLVEVKACGRLQSWATKQPTTPRWTFTSVRSRRVWSEAKGEYQPVEPASRVHVWVFALHLEEDPDRYDPLDVTQWEFRAIAHRQLLATDQVSAGLGFFERQRIAPVPYDDLAAAVRAARRHNDRLSHRAASAAASAPAG